MGVDKMKLKWKEFADGYITRLNGKYYYCNETAKEILEILNVSVSMEEAVVAVSKAMEIDKKEAEEWIAIVNKKPNEIQEYYKDVQNLDTPIKVQWKVTENCNLRCAHCWNGKIKEDNLDESEYLDIAKKICSWNVLEVTLTGGEIFTVGNIDEVIECFVSKNIYVNLFSNGILIDQHIDFLKNYKDLLQVNVSIDGNKEYHEKIRGKNTYEGMLKNVKVLIENGIKVVSNTVINKMNFLCIPEMIENLNKIGVKNIQISHLILKGNAVENQSKLLMNNNDYEEFRKLLYQYAKEHSNSHTHIYYSDVTDDTSKIYELKEENCTYYEDWICCAGVTRVTVNPNGDVVSCPFFKEYVMGNLLKDTVQDIWMSNKRLEFVKLKKKNNNGRHCIAYQFGRLNNEGK